MMEKVENFKRRKVFRVGGSVCVPLPRKMRQAIGISPGDYVRIVAVNEHSILIKKEQEAWGERISKRD